MLSSETYRTGDVLVLEVLDDPITVELRRLLHVFDIWAGFRTLVI